ncbi:sugar nucleotide-binding protein [Rhodospirillales bacterium]|nr:sugar nucleotide-binding protein [Rhodospirillales bacterium]
MGQLNLINSSTAVLIGADGFLGSHLRRSLANIGQNVISSSRRLIPEQSTNTFHLDLSKPDEIHSNLTFGAVSIICGAIVGFEECSVDPALSWQVNVEAPAIFSRLNADRGVRTVLISSNAVFSGDIFMPNEETTTGAKTEYGRQKEAAEKHVLGTSPDNQIIRVSKLVAHDIDTFMSWFENIGNGRKIWADEDVRRAPVHVNDAAHIISRIATECPGGIYHISGDRDLTYYEMAQRMIGELGGDQAQLIPRQRSRMIPEIEDLKPHTAMSMRRTMNILQINQPSSDDAVQSIIDELNRIKSQT